MDASTSSCSTISTSARCAHRSSRHAAREFVEEHFGANNLAAVVYTSGRSDATQDFTTDRAAAVGGHRQVHRTPSALGRHGGARTPLSEGADRDSNRPENYVDPDGGIRDSAAAIDVRDLEREQRALAVLDTLRNLGEFLSGVRGRRKAVLLFSEGLEMPMSEIYGIHTPTDVVGAIKDAVTAAARSNVNFFALDPRGLIGMTSEYIELAGSAAPGCRQRRVLRPEPPAGARHRVAAVAGQPPHAL